LQQATLARGSNDGLPNVWRMTSYVIAIPLVFYFEQALHEAIAVVLSGAVARVEAELTQGSQALMHSFDALTRDVHFLSLQGLLLAPVAVVLAIVLGILGLIALALLGVIGVPAVTMVWLAQQTGPLRYLLDLGLVGITGAFLSSIAFPVLGMLVALTVGELAYHRMQQRLLETPLNWRGPVSLVVGFLSLVLLIPGTQARELLLRAAESAWHRARKVGVSRPASVRPQAFTVAAGQTLRTGITVGARDEVRMTTTAPVKLGLTPSKKPPVLFFKTDASSGTDCYAGTAPSGPCRSNSFVFFAPGEITLFGGDAAATVHVWPPGYLGHYWFLQKGEIYTADEWVEPGDEFSYNGGTGLSFRVTNGGSASPWQELAAAVPSGRRLQLVPPAAAGHIEVRASTVPTWFSYPTVHPAPWRHPVDAESIVDTGIRVRRGDTFSVHVLQPGALYVLLNSGPSLLRHGRIGVESADYDGTIRLKGGPANTEALVRVNTRGPGWK
jgi:hypothetical protein